MDAPGSTSAGRVGQTLTFAHLTTAVPLHKQPQEGRRHERPVRVDFRLSNPPSFCLNGTYP
jgi:hypothetical protein